MSRRVNKWIVLGSGNGSTNLGDEAMWEAAARFLRDRYPQDVIVTDGPRCWDPPVKGVKVLPNLSLDLRRGRHIRARTSSRLGRLAEVGISYPQRNYYARKVATKSRLEALPIGRLWAEEIRSSRGVIFSGAGAINDDYAVHGVYAWLMLARFAARNGIPMAMVGQGLGPLNAPKTRLSAQELLGYPSIVSVRESKSFDLLTEMRRGGNSKLTPDWALALRPSKEDEQEAAQLASKYIGDSRFVIVSAHRRHSTNSNQLRRVSNDVQKIVLDAEEQNLRVLFVGNMYAGRYSDDRDTAFILRRSLPVHLRERLIVPSEALRAGVVRSLIGRSSGIVSTRYHPMVFAFGEGVPSIGLTYDEYYVQKLRGISSSFGVAGNTFEIGELSKSGRPLMELLSDAERQMGQGDHVATITAPLRDFVGGIDGQC